MNLDSLFESILDCLDRALEGQGVEDFEPIFQDFKSLAQIFLIEDSDGCSTDSFVLELVARIYHEDGDEDEPHFNPICPPFKLGKLLYADVDLKELVEKILKSGNIFEHSVTPKKLQFLNEALHCAKNYHPNYLPEHLLQC